MVTAAELPLTAVGPDDAEVGVAVAAGGDVGAVVAVGGAPVLVVLVVPPQPARNKARTNTARTPGARNRRVAWDFKDIECLLLVGNVTSRLCRVKTLS